MQTTILQTAARLRERGIGRGDHVAILAAGGPAYAVLVVACWTLGAVVVPISTRFSLAQVEVALTALGCQWLVSDRDTRRPSIAIDSLALYTVPAWKGVCLKDLDLVLDDPASVVLTSGSTGQPKGVLHTLDHHYYSALGAHQNIPFEREHAWLVSLPMYHMGGLALIMRALLHGGGLIFPSEKASLIQSLRRSDVTHVSLVPTQLRQIMMSDSAPPIKAVLVGGAACPPGLVNQAVDRGLPVYLTYGLTEMASQVSTTASGEAAHVPDTSGRVLPYRQLRISAEGEILVKGHCRFAGYVQDDHLICPCDREGWFATGDHGRIDDHDRLYVMGRCDTMFVSGGENIYPEEIEKAIMGLPGVEACLVVPVEDAIYGHRPVAFVKSSGTLSDLASLEDVIERFKIPDRVLPWPDKVPLATKANRFQFARRAASLVRE